MGGEPARARRGLRRCLLCVSNDKAVGEVVFGEDGLSGAAGAGKLLVDHSTIHPMTTREWAARLQGKNGMTWVDAPVSGGPGGAKRGELIVMAGGSVPITPRSSGLFEADHAHGSGRIGPGDEGVQPADHRRRDLRDRRGPQVRQNFGLKAAALPDALKGGWADSTVLQDHGRRMAGPTIPDPASAAILDEGDMNIACDMARLTDADAR